MDSMSDTANEHEGGLPPNMLPPQANMAQSYYPDAPTDLTGGLPISLDSLRDGPPGSKPFYPYSTLIRYAIKGSPHQKLLLEDIYYAIESRFPYFRNAPAGWKNSVRHNLSLNPCFEKVPRPLTDRGKGSYWTVNDNVDPRTGVHRVRKKRPTKKSQHPVADQDYHPSEMSGAGFEGAYEAAMQADGTSDRTAYAAAFGTFNDGLSMMGHMQYPFEGELDEHGNVNWRACWQKELNNLQHMTAEHDKANTDADWYRMMFYRLRSALIAPLSATDMTVGAGQAQHGIAAPLAGELQQAE